MYTILYAGRLQPNCTIFPVNRRFCEAIALLNFNQSNVLGHFVYSGRVRVELSGNFLAIIFVYHDHEHALLITCKNACLILGIVCKRPWHKCGIAT